MKRKIIFHAGPTNSGKTYHALKRFQDSNSGIYGGPLRMLAAEVYSRTNLNVRLYEKCVHLKLISEEIFCGTTRFIYLTEQ